MKKSPLILTALFGALLSISSFAANETGNSASSMPKQCERLFNETENLVADAEKQPGTHTQVGKIKNKLNQSKQQILAMDVAVQVKSCEQGLAKLSNLKRQDKDEVNN